MACFCFLNCLFIIFQAIFYSSAPPNSLVCWSEDSPCHKKIKPRFEKLVVRFNSPPPGAPRKGLSPIIIPRRFLVRRRPPTNDDKNENNTDNNSNGSNSCTGVNSSSDGEKKTSTTSTPPPPQPQTPVRRPVTPPADDDAVEMLALMLKQRLAQAKRRRQLFHDDDEQTTSTNTVAVSESLQREIDAFLAHSEIDDLFATVDLSSLEFSYSQPSSSNAPTPYERYKASVTTNELQSKSEKKKNEAEAEKTTSPQFISFDDDDEFFATAEVLEILRQY